MKGPLAKLVTNYERSGNGDGMRRDDDSEIAFGFDVTNCIEGSNIGMFLQQNDPCDLLYWWHVLQDADMLHYTISILSDEVGSSSYGTPSVLSTTRSENNSSEKEKKQSYPNKLPFFQVSGKKIIN
jgi:hypothetical protein